MDTIKGKITVEFYANSLTPKIKLEGDFDLLQMSALPYQLGMEYQEHLNRLGDALRKKVAAKGIPSDKPSGESDKNNETNKEQVNA